MNIFALWLNGYKENHVRRSPSFEGPIGLLSSVSYGEKYKMKTEGKEYLFILTIYMFGRPGKS